MGVRNSRRSNAWPCATKICRTGHQFRRLTRGSVRAAEVAVSKAIRLIPAFIARRLGGASRWRRPALPASAIGSTPDRSPVFARGVHRHRLQSCREPSTRNPNILACRQGRLPHFGSWAQMRSLFGAERAFAAGKMVHRAASRARPTRRPRRGRRADSSLLKRIRPASGWRYKGWPIGT